jgi:hypothetical protein
MDNNRLEQEKAAARSTQPRTGSKDWKRVKEREEELRGISPLFQKMEGSYPQEPSPQAWKGLSQNLARQLQSYKAPMFQTVRDKLTATDSALGQWFWIIVALVLLAVTAGIITLTVGAGDLVPSEAWSRQSPAKAPVEIVRASETGYTKA